jgi:hypothetical protein
MIDEISKITGNERQNETRPPKVLDQNNQGKATKMEKFNSMGIKHT